jgi:hypothetical protein
MSNHILAVIRNDTVWRDDRGEEIMCQGGSLCRFGDRFCFYGWGDYAGDNRNDSVTCYSSLDLAQWRFENHVFRRNQTDLTLIVPDRLHVLYNDATRQYVMIGKHILPYADPEIPGQPRVTGGVSYFCSPSPSAMFTYLGHEMLPVGSGTDYHRDLCAFKDSDGVAYVASSHDQHQSLGNIMITRLTADYLHVDRLVCEIPLSNGAFEAPYLIKLKDRYWLFLSGRGQPTAWNGSPTYYSSSPGITGPWPVFRQVETVPPSPDSFNAQSDFLFEVTGSEGSFVLWGGDRYSQRTMTGTGKNVWLPLQWRDGEPCLKWCSAWQPHKAQGTWSE